MPNKLVSIIISTKNSGPTLAKWLQSIEMQSYRAIETIVVDNNSTDNTKQIATKYTSRVFNYGPERSAQRNFGVKQSVGGYVLIVDSDMELSKNVVEDCVSALQKNERTVGAIIPEESFGQGFWAKCKKLEKSFYIGVDWIESARFFKRDACLSTGGYNESLISVVDLDLSQRIEQMGKLVHVQSFIFHNEGRLSLLQTVKKKYYYACHFNDYIDSNVDKNRQGKQISLVYGFRLFFSCPSKLFMNLIIEAEVLFMAWGENAKQNR